MARFCKVMDSSKSGLTVRKDVWEKDMRAFNCAPAWRGTSGPFDETNMVPLKRDPHLGSFIMDELLKEAKVQGDFQIARIERGFKVFQPNTEDIALSAPFREVMKKLTCPEVGSFYRGDLESIHKHVRSGYSSVGIPPGTSRRTLERPILALEPPYPHTGTRARARDANQTARLPTATSNLGKTPYEMPQGASPVPSTQSICS